MEATIHDINIIRPEELAKMLRLSKPRVYQLAEEGKIPSIRIGKSVRFLAEDVKAFIADHRREKREA